MWGIASQGTGQSGDTQRGYGQQVFLTRKDLAHHDPEQDVSASVALISSVALMFWYVVGILMRARA